jgi:hypothetical protein
MSTAQRPGIDLHGAQEGWCAFLSCIVCDSIVHIRDVDFPFQTRGSLSGDGVRIWMQCEEGHRFVIETEDHSGMMAMRTIRVRPDVEPYS